MARSSGKPMKPQLAKMTENSNILRSSISFMRTAAVNAASAMTMCDATARPRIINPVFRFSGLYSTSSIASISMNGWPTQMISFDSTFDESSLKMRNRRATYPAASMMNSDIAVVTTAATVVLIRQARQAPL